MKSIDNVIELRIRPKKELDLEDISYFVHNGWTNFKTDLHEGYYVLVRSKPPQEAFELIEKVYEYGADYQYED